MEKNPNTQSLVHSSPLQPSGVHRRLLSAGLLAGVSVVAGAGVAAAATPSTVDAGVRTVASAPVAVSPAALPVTWRTGSGASDRGTTFVDVTL